MSESTPPSKDDGGPAFPTMTLRDYFAAGVLQGFAANPAIFAQNAQYGWSLVNATDDDIAGYAYKLADSMLGVRST